MRILFAAPTYLPSRRANTIQVMKMAEAAQLSGHDVHILVPDPASRKHPEWEALAHHYGLSQPFQVEWVPVIASLRSYDYGVKVVAKFRKLNPDILYTRLPQAAALASVLKIPTIYEIHDLPGGFWGPWLLKLFLRGRGARRLVTITRSLSDSISRLITPLPGYPFSLIAPDGVDLKRYERIPKPEAARKSLRLEHHLELSPGCLTVGYTGHLYPGRGVESILEMAARCPQISFLVVGGDPPAVAKVKDWVAQRGLQNVFLTGFIPNADLPRYQAACEVLLMPYQLRVEASSGGDIAQFLSPMKSFEYMAAGRIILASRLPVLTEILNDENAILLPPDEVGAWVSELEEIQKDPSRYHHLARQARLDSGKYSWEKRVRDIFAMEGQT